MWRYYENFAEINMESGHCFKSFGEIHWTPKYFQYKLTKLNIYLQLH